MAEDFDFESRTETPTPRRREEAYERGQFAFSTELNTGIVLMAGIGGLAFLAHTLGAGLLAQTRSDFLFMPTQDMTAGLVQNMLGNLFMRGMVIAGALLGLLLAATIAVNLGQTGLHWNMERLGMDWERISPFQLSRLFDWNKVVRALFLVAKVGAVAAVAWWILRQRTGAIAQIGDSGLAAAVACSWGIILRLALGMAGMLLAIGVADYAYQRWRFERSLYMTRQELKEEIKREEGDPQIKARIRRMQREIAQRKMFQKVPKATVVVTNPTHLAVALMYEPGAMGAPKVVAKGAGHVAKRIVEMARRHGVPVLERKPLAQALFKAVKVDREIPLALYVIVAELLAHVYQLKNGMPPPKPGIASLNGSI